MERERRGTPSTASILGHPIHPMLVPFPMAFLIGALVSDLAFWATGDAFWARASFWLIAAGLVMGVAAALAGLTDFLTIRHVRDEPVARYHFLGNGLVLLLSLVNLLVRWAEPMASVLPWGLLLSAVVTGVLGFTGWLGGELAYRHGIGMSGSIVEPGPVAEAERAPRGAPMGAQPAPVHRGGRPPGEAGKESGNRNTTDQP